MLAELLDRLGAVCDGDFSVKLPTLANVMRVLSRDDDRIISHAAWVTRWLQPRGQALLRTGYIEAVATLPDCRRGLAGNRGLGHGWCAVTPGTMPAKTKK